MHEVASADAVLMMAGISGCLDILILCAQAPLSGTNCRRSRLEIYHGNEGIGVAFGEGAEYPNHLVEAGLAKGRLMPWRQTGLG
jgi:hypothetical protein